MYQDLSWEIKCGRFPPLLSHLMYSLISLLVEWSNWHEETVTSFFWFSVQCWREHQERSKQLVIAWPRVLKPTCDCPFLPDNLYVYTWAKLQSPEVLDSSPVDFCFVYSVELFKLQVGCLEPLVVIKNEHHIVSPISGIHHKNPTFTECGINIAIIQ